MLGPVGDTLAVVGALAGAVRLLLEILTKR